MAPAETNNTNRNVRYTQWHMQNSKLPVTPLQLDDSVQNSSARNPWFQLEIKFSVVVIQYHCFLMLNLNKTHLLTCSRTGRQSSLTRVWILHFFPKEAARLGICTSVKHIRMIFSPFQSRTWSSTHEIMSKCGMLFNANRNIWRLLVKASSIFLDEYNKWKKANSCQDGTVFS